MAQAEAAAATRACVGSATTSWKTASARAKSSAGSGEPVVCGLGSGVWGILCSVGEFAEEPCPSEVPVAFDGGGCDAEGLGGVVDGHAGEEPHLDGTGFAVVEGGEFGERDVEGDEVGAEVVGRGGDDAGFVEGDAVSAAAAFEAVGVAGVVDEDAAHGLGGDGEEVGTAGEACLGLVDELEVGLVDEGGGLEGVAGAFASEEGAREGAELVVDEWEEGIDSAGVAA